MKVKKTSVCILFLNLCESYEQVHIMGMTKHVNFEDLSMVIKEIISVHSKNFHHPILAPLKTVFG